MQIIPIFQTFPSSSDLGSVVDMVVAPNGKYKTGTCDVTVPFPDTSATYSYKMVVTPGRVDVPAGFETGSSFQISMCCFILFIYLFFLLLEIFPK